MVAARPADYNVDKALRKVTDWRSQRKRVKLEEGRRSEGLPGAKAAGLCATKPTKVG